LDKNKLLSKEVTYIQELGERSSDGEGPRDVAFLQKKESVR
jgi:hypothetical protein